MASINSDGIVLKLLRSAGPLSRAELARRAALSATTLTKVTARLSTQGRVRETTAPDKVADGAIDRAAGKPSIGRPPIDIALVADRHAMIGVHVGAGAVHVAITDLTADIEARASLSFDASIEPVQDVIDRICDLLDETIARADLPEGRLLGIGIGVPGPVDRDRRRLLLSINTNWRDVPFADAIERRMRLPVVVGHNVRAMALAEHLYGGGAAARALLYVYLGTGLGAGLVVDGEPFRPGSYGVTELGHIQVVEAGAPCPCGSNGCLETVLSEPFLRRELGMPDDTSAALMRALDAAPTVRDAAVDHLTTALASATNLLNPDLIALGGLFVDASDELVDAITASLRGKAFPLLRDTIAVRRSGLGHAAGTRGAAALALETLFYVG